MISFEKSKVTVGRKLYVSIENGHTPHCGYQITALSVFFDVLLPTCKLDWILIILASSNI